MKFGDAMKELERLGTEQNRKIYKRHGAPEPMFGVSFANLESLRKKIKTNQPLADALWASRNLDARSLALMIADPATYTHEKLEQWIHDAPNHMLVGLLVGHVASKVTFARETAERWITSDDEHVGAAGWGMIASLAMESSLQDGFFEALIPIIQTNIHGAKNRTRYSMNNALIAIGGRSEGLREKAIAAAKRIGKVEVDHGETGCKTPDAVPYIEKMWARKKGGAASSRKKKKEGEPARKASGRIAEQGKARR